jgi:hypothetical protein
MEIAIRLTQQHLDLNKELLITYSVGDIKSFKELPRTWNNIKGFKSASNEELYALGFKELVTPEFISQEKLGGKIEDTVNDVFTFQVVALTPIELEEYEQDNQQAIVKYRNEVLQKGIVVDGVWFNEAYLGNFVSALTIIKNVGGTTIEWKNDLDVWVTLTLAEADILASKAMAELQLIYKNY